MPWQALIDLIEPHYPKANKKGGRPPYPLATMLRVHLLKHGYLLCWLRECAGHIGSGSACRAGAAGGSPGARESGHSRRITAGGFRGCRAATDPAPTARCTGSVCLRGNSPPASVRTSLPWWCAPAPLRAAQTIAPQKPGSPGPGPSPADPCCATPGHRCRGDAPADAERGKKNQIEVQIHVVAVHHLGHSLEAIHEGFGARDWRKGNHGRWRNGPLSQHQRRPTCQRLRRPVAGDALGPGLSRAQDRPPG